MRNDEFNYIEITNDKQLRGVEFGKTQTAEFTSKKENETPEGELNEKYIGKTVKQIADVNVDYVNKVQTHTTQTVVSSSTTATSAAAAVASTAVVASTVAVVAIATATGISVTLHDYQCELTSLLISSNEISYSFSIRDNKKDDGIEYQTYEESPKGRYLAAGNPSEEEPTYEEYEEYIEDSIYNKKRPFVLIVSNDTYQCEHYLGYGKSEYGTFYDLTLGDTYSIVLKENRYGGDTLYEKEFTTAPNSGFREFYIGGEADFRRGTFGVYLDYLDELECLSEFTVTFIDKENSDNVFTIPLENMAGYQQASVFSAEQSDLVFDFEKEYSYTFTYKKNEDVIEFATGEVKFYNSSSYVSEVAGVDWDHKANFLTNQTTITLNYQDDYDLFSDFKLVLMPEEAGVAGGSDTLVYDLIKTTEPQTVTLTDNEEFSYVLTYSYMFTYMEEGKDVEQIIESDSGLRFEDNSGTAVNGVTWNKTINLLTKQFKLTLDYQDDESYKRFSNFQLIMKDEEMPEEMYDEPYNLEKTTAEQTVTIYEDSNLRLRKPILYTFTYFDKLDSSTHVLEEGTVTFTDNSNGQKEFNGVIINPTPDMANNTIEVQLDYVDDFEELYSFTLNLYVNDDDIPISIYLDSTTDKQTVDVADYDLDFSKTYHYFVTYYDDATWEEVSPDIGKGTITFDHSIFNEFIFNKTANFDTKAFDVQLDYVDDFNVFSNFELTIEDDYDQSETFTLEKTTSVQTLYLNQTITEDDGGEPYEYDKFNIRGGLFTYSFKYHDALLGEDVVIDSEQFNFTNTLESTFTGVVSPFDFTTEDSGSSYLLPLRFEYDDLGQIYTSFDVQICQDGEPVSSLRFEGETETKDWLYGVFVPDGLDINDIINADNTSIKVVASLDTENNPFLNEFERTVYEKDVTFTLGKEKEIFGGNIVTDHIMWGSDIGFQLVYSGHPDEFADCELQLEGESGKIYRFAIQQLSPASNYCCIYMDSDSIGDSFDEDDFRYDFLEHPMKVSILYYILTNGISPVDSTGGDITQVKNGPFVTVLHESFQFYESV